MKYIPLKKVYYKNIANSQIWQDEYSLRFNSPTTKHLNFIVHEIDRREEFPLFYCYTEEITTLINNILTATLRLFKCIDTAPNAAIKQFLDSSLISEVKFSNDIEGVRSTRKEIQEALSQIEPQKYVRLWGIVNKYRKIINNENISLKNCQDIRSLYDDFVLQEVIRANPRHFPDGIIFRKDPVNIETATQKVIHRGQHPEEKIIHDLENALDILYDKNIPALIRISIFHYLFGYIHPFYDGNGRMSRFITSYLLSQEIHPTVALHLSFLIKRNRKKYYSLFEDTNSSLNKGDLTPFITSSLTLIYNTIENIIGLLNKKIERFISYLPILDKLTLTDDTSKGIYYVLLQAAIFSDYGATTEEIATTLKKSTKTIKSRISQIPSEEIFIDKTTRPYHYKVNLSTLEKYTSNK